MRDQCVEFVKMMMTLVLVAMAASALLISCVSLTSISPYEHGYAVGTAIYAGYGRVAEGKDDAFHNRMAILWRKINEIDNVDTLATDIAELTGIFDALVSSGRYTDEEVAAMKALRGMVLDRLDTSIGKSGYGSRDALKFLDGARAGINAMVALHNASQKEATDDKDN